MTCGVERTREELEKIVISLGYVFLGEYTKDKARRVIFSDIMGYKYDVNIGGLIRGHIPEIFRHTNPFSLENISLWLKTNNKPFKLKENNKYVNNIHPLFFHCEVCDEDFRSTWSQILQGAFCGICEGGQVGKTNNFKYLRPDMVSEWSSKNKIKPDEVTANSGKYILWKCSKCGHEWSARVADRNAGRGCPSCAGQIVTDKNRLSVKFPELCEEWDWNKNKKIKPTNVSYGSGKKVWWKCRECNFEWTAPINNRTNVKSGCPNCAANRKESKIAIELKYFLESEGYNVIFEYKILKNPKTMTYLPYDIYLPDKNIFIEVHGEQHYKINGYHKLSGKRKGTGAEKEFKYQKYKDRLKKDFANKNGTYVEVDARKPLNFSEIINLIENN
jgi:predicted Zn-ribbon and HTH transcriptional regulator